MPWISLKSTWKPLAFLLLTSLILYSCASDKQKFIPDVSHIEADIPIRRFDLDLFQLDTNNMATELAALEAKYPVFSDLFFSRLIGSKDSIIAPMGHEAYVRGFITHPSTRNLFDTAQIVYPNLNEIQEQFNQAGKFVRYYFPEVEIPHVTTFISEFTIANFIYEGNGLAAGLDFFLGDEFAYQYYNAGNPNFSDYLTRTYNRDHLVQKTMKALTEDLAGEPQGNRMIDYMIHNGKKRFLLERILPYISDTVLFEYSASELAWCEENERELWAHFLTEDLLYSSNFRDFRKLVEPSPGDPGLPPDAPGRTANWIGWRIVHSFMERHPDMSLQDLIDQKEAQTILDRSKYKPTR
jgi:hypothetical protein